MVCGEEEKGNTVGVGHKKDGVVLVLEGADRLP